MSLSSRIKKALDNARHDGLRARAFAVNHLDRLVEIEIDGAHYYDGTTGRVVGHDKDMGGYLVLLLVETPNPGVRWSLDRRGGCVWLVPPSDDYRDHAFIHVDCVRLIDETDPPSSALHGCRDEPGEDPPA